MRGRAQRLPRNANQVSTACGITQGCVVLAAWFVGCLVGYQCKASIDSIWGKRLVAWFVCCWWATHPFFLTLLPLVVVLVGSACLTCRLLGFGEDTYSDGWIMDRGKNVTFWCVGLLAVIACVIQCLMDMHFSVCCLLMDGWMDGWMAWMDGRTDGWMDGWMLCKSRREGVRGRAQRYGMGGFGCLVCWLLGGFVGLAALLLGWLVGWLALR